jgi:hypothetical protein
MPAFIGRVRPALLELEERRVDTAIVQFHFLQATGCSPGFAGFPHVGILVAGVAVAELAGASRCHTVASSGVSSSARLVIANSSARARIRCRDRCIAGFRCWRTEPSISWDGSPQPGTPPLPAPARVLLDQHPQRGLSRPGTDSGITRGSPMYPRSGLAGTGVPLRLC